MEFKILFSWGLWGSWGNGVWGFEIPFMDKMEKTMDILFKIIGSTRVASSYESGVKSAAKVRSHVRGFGRK